MKAAAWRKITADEVRVVPWKNGGGLTTEIAIGPPRLGDHDWSWRVSIADVPSTGPFSRFPGIDRSIAVIEGGGMDLRFADGRVVPLELNRPVDFDGGVPVDGILRTDPIRDFNVMADRRYFRPRLEIVAGLSEIQRAVPGGSVLLVHILDGAGTVTARDGGAVAIRKDESVIWQGKNEVSVSVESGARAAIVVLTEVAGN